MESYFPMGGFQLPFQRRLSRLYNDTKKSTDFVKEPVQNAEDPEIKALHRKLRIQKDRLVSWGLEWSDPSQSAEVLIDSSLSKAGLSEVVGSIMSTIKDILAEAEPLWLSSKRLVGEKEPEKGAADRKLPMVAWDKGRFEDLVRDLTTSIDTLYDLSRTRSSAATSSQAARARLYKSGGSMEDLRPFESTRMQTPQQIDSQTLTNLRSMQAEPMSESAATMRPRDIVFMSKQAYSDITRTSGRQQYSPLLLEYANFDPIYSTTGIMPSMSRFEKLSSGLQVEPQRSPGSWTGLPRLLGYFEDMEHSRLGLVYQFPTTFNPVSFEHLTQNPLYNLCSLADLLKKPDFEPKLEAKFRLASNLANTVFDMHARGIVHGNLVDSNISFCNTTGIEPGMSTSEVDVRRPLVSSFDLFPDSSLSDTVAGAFSLYRHALDPRVTPPGQAPIISNADTKVFDLYSLAMLLLSIGLWTDLENLTSHPASTSIAESVLDQLAIRCGTLYMKAVQACWTAVDKELSGQVTGDALQARVQLKASRYLEACCILDGVSNLEERLSDDLGEESATAHARAAPQPTAGSSKDAKQHRKTADDILPPISERGATAPPAPSETVRAPSTATAKQESARTRWFPHVPLPPETVDYWHTSLMPQVDRALRRFSRENPESVEISLKSIGKSPKETRPTVVVVCTSVNKVRAILKRRLGSLFDGTTGFRLKVCYGQLVRSRNPGVPRSMAKGDGEEAKGVDTAAANGDFQERPQNGASIGAWVGDRHLPPVSFGGLVLVDDKPYGMTVHHMLDAPDGGSARAPGEQGQQVLRSSAADDEIEALNEGLKDWYASLPGNSSTPSSSDDEFDYGYSDSDSDVFHESDITSDWSDENSESDEEDHEESEPGDIPGIEPGCGDGYIVTQPALDDISDGFYPNPDTQDDDHLDSFSLGEIYASSGIRRRRDENGMVHEIDWALFEFKDERLPDENSIPRRPARSAPDKNQAQSPQSNRSSFGPGSPAAVHPTQVAPSKALPGLEVQCIARTSGFQTGMILPAMSRIKIYGRCTSSQTFEVMSTPSTKDKSDQPWARPGLMGIPGDSGAWIVDRAHGRLCGHVLAYSKRNRLAYICPMDLLLLDIAETLEAREVRLPGGEAVAKLIGAGERRKNSSYSLDEGWETGDENDGPAGRDRGYREVEDTGDMGDDEAGPLDDKAAFRDSGLGQSTGSARRNTGLRQSADSLEEADLSAELRKMHLRQKGVRAPC